ncbi:MAG: DUF445 domain-containing protein [Chitinophagales bacterium]
MIYTLPFIAALIGWFTNFLAVKMLFHPRQKTKILFVEVQGIFPKRQKALAEKLGKVVSKELLSFDDIRGKLKDPKNLESVNEMIEDKIGGFLNDKLPEKYPMLSLLLSDSAKNKLKKAMMREIDGMIPAAIDQFIDKTEEKIDIEEIVYDKVAKFSPEKLEDIVFGILQKEFKFIELVGALLGFMVGCIQLLMMSFLG